MKLYDAGLLIMVLVFLGATTVAEFEDGKKLADEVFEPEQSPTKVRVVK